MRKKLCIIALAAASLAAAQTPARLEIDENPLLSASNYLAYIDPTEPLSAAPRGYEPFYLSHYGRHGSRWLIGRGEYADALGALQRAAEQGKLTARGELLLRQLQDFNLTTQKRLGELTTVGEAQHHRIGRRWPERFPQIFKQRNTQIDARSTTVIRCILSMTAACEELSAANPRARIHNDVSESFQYYLNADWTARTKRDNKQRWADNHFDYNREYVHPERWWSAVFNDPDWRDDKVTSRGSLMKKVFAICSNMQSHEGAPDLYDLFTPQERYDLWRCENIGWYIGYAQGTAPYTQANLLENILATADTITGSRDYHGATLRYGHEVCVMPLAALLELGGCYPEVPAEGLDTLDRVWANYRIFPMASNVQLVFYRPTKGQGDVLVKALLNEREVTLPATPVTGVYYRWEDLRAYYRQKLDDYYAADAGE